MKDFISYIKNFSTREFINFFSEISIELYKKQQAKSEGELMCNMTFPLDILKYGFVHKQVQVMLSAWDIPEMAYVSITNANDYGKEVMTREKVGIVVNLYRGYENECTKKGYSNGEMAPDIWKLMTGMTYEQFRYQNLAWTYQSFNRNYHILVGAEKICRDKIIDINRVTQELFGMNTDEYLACIMYLLLLCSVSPKPLEIETNAYKGKISNVVSRENLKKIINYYSITYDAVRKSLIQKQIFYSKPFVIAEKKEEPIMVSIYLMQMLLAEGLYWLIRDYYFNNNLGIGFINEFGTMFEVYFEELAEFYLTEGMWHKIPEQESKSADFFVEFENVVFLFELKSGLLGIMAKQQVPDIQQIDTFYKRNILEAYEQLKQSEEEYQGRKPIIKVFLLYETMMNTQVMMTSIPEVFVDNSLYYIMTVDDLERLLATYKYERDKFSIIVNTLITNQNGTGHTTSVLHVLNDCNAVNHEYFVGERDYFLKIAQLIEP